MFKTLYTTCCHFALHCVACCRDLWVCMACCCVPCSRVQGGPFSCFFVAGRGYIGFRTVFCRIHCIMLVLSYIVLLRIIYLWCNRLRSAVLPCGLFVPFHIVEYYASSYYWTCWVRSELQSVHLCRKLNFSHCKCLRCAISNWNSLYVWSPLCYCWHCPGVMDGDWCGALVYGRSEHYLIHQFRPLLLHSASFWWYSTDQIIEQ